MLNVSDETKKAYLDCGIPKTIRIKFPDVKDGAGNELVLTNDEIVQGSLTIDSKIQSGNKIDFIGCQSSKAEFKIVRNNYDLIDKKVIITVQAGNTEEISMFTGIVDSCKRDHAYAMCKTIIAYDVLHDMLEDSDDKRHDVTEWYRSLGDNFKMSLKEFRDSLFKHLELEQVETTLLNDDITVDKNIDVDEKEEKDKEGNPQYNSVITAESVLNCICQINLAHGYINGEGKFEYATINLNKVYHYDNDYLIRVKFEDKETKKITGVALFDDTSEEYEDTGEAIAYVGEVTGKDSHPFEITSNFLLYGRAQDDAMIIANRLWEKLKDFVFTDFEIEAKGLPFIQMGDTISFEAPASDMLVPSTTLYPSNTLYPKGNLIITSPVLNRRFSGTSLFRDNLSAKGEDIDSNVRSLNEIIEAERFYRKLGDDKNYSELEQTKTTFRTQVTDLDKRVTSEIKQTADRIEMSVERLDMDQSAITTRLILTENEISAHSKQIEMVSEQLSLTAADVIDMKAEVIELTAESVTFEDLSGSGKTVIHGGNIRTGTLNCGALTTGTIELNGKKYEAKWGEMAKVVAQDRSQTVYLHKKTLIIPSVKEETIRFMGADGTPSQMNVLVRDGLDSEINVIVEGEENGCFAKIDAITAPTKKIIYLGAIVDS